MAKSTLELGTAVLDFIQRRPKCSSKEIHDAIGQKIGYATTKRAIKALLAEGLLVAHGKGKGTKYEISQSYELLTLIDPEQYFQKEIDEREI